jgi:NADP-dependent alcohol dehydrogenase
MQNFTFYNPVKIVFGKDALDSLSEELKDFGSTVLFVYGKNSIKKSGLYDRIVKTLKETGKEIVEHGGVKSNPLLSHTKEGIEKAKTHKADCILAVGGGSVIDESKAIAAGSKYNGDVWDFYLGKETVTDALPLMTVLTIPATGTEMNNGTVIMNDETLDKVGFGADPLYPKVSFLDPTLTYTIPKEYTAYSGVDAMSHCVEGYFTHTEKYAPVQERYVEGLVKAIMDSIDRIIEDPENYDARAAFMWAASLAWNGLTMTGLSGTGVPSHLLAHPLSSIYDLAHGATLSITIPAWMAWAHEQGNPKVALFARNVMGVDEQDDDTAAVEGIKALKSWYKKIDSPVYFKDADIPESDLDKITGVVYNLAQIWGMDLYTKEVIKGILARCM